MSFNVAKCCALHLSTNNVNNVYTIDGVPIPSQPMYTDLGVMRDCDLLYISHINSIVANAHRLCAALLRVFVTRNSNTLKSAYFTYIRPRLDFASQIWSPHTKYLINRIERVQKLFSKRVRGTTGLNYEQRLALLNIDPLDIRRIKTDLITLYKIVHGLLDINLHDIGLSVNISNTRAHNVKLILPCPCTNVLKYSFAYRTGFIYNRLPLDVLSANNLHIFVTRLHSVSFAVLRGQPV